MFGRVVAALARAMARTRVADARRRGPHARGVALFVALALQYASQPFLRARYAANARASALVLSVEIAKATLCACALLRRRETRGALRRASARSLLASGAPAAVYAAQNVLLQRGARALDGVTFNCLNQTKLASAAAFLWLGGARQSRAQCLALVGTLAAAVNLFGGETAAGGGGGAASAAARAAGATSVLVASALSGLSGAMCQFALQGSEKLPAMMTLEMAITGVPMVLLAERVAAGDEFRLSAVYESWTAWALVPVLSSAIGGILVGEITKRLGSIAKGFAVTCGLVLTGVFQSVFAGAAPPRAHVVSLIVIVISTWVHTAFPPVEKRKKKRKTG